MEPYEMMDDKDASQISQPQSTQVAHTHPRKPVIIGLYGLPESGNTFWLEELKAVIRNDGFAFYDGSEAKTDYCEQATARIKRECCKTGKTAIVAGHFVFWLEKDEECESVCSPEDLVTYTHILYLDPPADLIAEYRLNDAKRSRPNVSTSEACCQDVSSMVDMHLDILRILHLVRETRHVRAVVGTCGIQSVWENALGREGSSETVKVIGGGRVADGLLITPCVKAELITYLQTTRHLHVIAVGNSPLDLAMLQVADQAVVVTGEESTRSKSMEKQLAEVIGKKGFQPCQVLRR
ncbi:hypothetical protein PENCOP_c011G01953 [Penicillium coprophilum]|uniref:Uncharacterized protein n=1 Tax=Penicillium coprophilum TaxID=36646 RepID=A0A1V6UEM4_9EURO|nr:hypothetical protein PENCOP_c011G01953 [Penicillium coprophilum]